MKENENKITLEEHQESENVEFLIYEIDLRRQEIDAILENYEFELYEKGNEVLTEEEYINLKEEYKQLKKKRKNLIKSKGEKTIWDEIPLWMGFYAVFQFLFSFYYIQALLSVYFAKLLLDLFSQSNSLAFNIFSFILPFLSVVASLIILLLLKNKKRKKVFLFVFLIQLVETLITVGLMLSIILKS
ncbi:MAG: hypothetical protein M0R05_00015 [Bacilli bacterium]|nr:hypothetical protein [Bacilli bacterium]MDD4076541.1 hypothetical protein [Bacilli bacterium]MDD4387751.1 hypothetical protein [Bacilli bacterium]